MAVLSRSVVMPPRSTYSQVQRICHPTARGRSQPHAAGSRELPTRIAAATTPGLAPLADPDLVVRVRVGARQLQVLRLLDTHRLLAAAHIHAVDLETATRRSFEVCLQRLHQKGWVEWAEPLHRRPGGGRRGYV